MYKHEQLLAENAVAPDALPVELQHMVSQFNEQQFELDAEISEEEPSKEELRALRAELKKLDAILYREIKALLDNEFTEELSAEETKIAILEEFLRSGQTKPKVAALKQAGYPFRSTLKVNERAGRYKLIKKRYDSHCTIVQ